MTTAAGGSPEQWPAWATERVEIAAADPGWAGRGEACAAELDHLLAPWLRGPVEHVGSTAVPGLAAKPVLDLQAPVGDLGAADEMAAVLRPLGWHLVPPDLDERDWRRFFVLVVDGHRGAHLHVLAADSTWRRDHLDFRDALRADPAVRDAYADLKRHLAVRHGEDREAYTDAKADFVRAVLAGRPAEPA